MMRFCGSEYGARWTKGCFGELTGSRDPAPTPNPRGAGLGVGVRGGDQVQGCLADLLLGDRVALTRFALVSLKGSEPRLIALWFLALAADEVIHRADDQHPSGKRASSFQHVDVIGSIARTEGRDQQDVMGHGEGAGGGSRSIGCNRPDAYETCGQGMRGAGSQEDFVLGGGAAELDSDIEVQVVAWFAVGEQADLGAVHVDGAAESAVIRVINHRNESFFDRTNDRHGSTSMGEESQEWGGY